MNEEKITRKSIFISRLRSKLTYPFNFEDLEEVENIIDYYEKETQELKEQLEEYQLQNIDLRVDIMIQKQAFPNKLIKDKTFYDLFDMPTYEDLLNQQKENQKLKEQLKKKDEIIDDAIKYIQKEVKREGFHNYLDDENMNELLEILQKYKGDKK